MNMQILAYIGPGAGIAFFGSFLLVLGGVIAAAASVAVWPLRLVVRIIRRRRRLTKPKVGRVVVVGLDGLDPDLTEKFMTDGELPNLSRLRDTGHYSRLQTTWPPLSPVAWSSFSTGTNPGKHAIYDFVDPDRRSYGLRMSSVKIQQVARHLRLGPLRVPMGRPSVQGLRRSKPFWCVLGESGIRSAVLRVPISFPPDAFDGVQLSAMCVPDLLGTQGTAFIFRDDTDKTESRSSPIDRLEQRVLAHRRGGTIYGRLTGPRNHLRGDGATCSIPFVVTANRNGSFTLKLQGKRIPLKLKTFTDWVTVQFRLAPWLTVTGIVRMRLESFDPKFVMYCSPVQINPSKPVMPISHPVGFSRYLAGMIGQFSTLGLAEDTSSFSNGMLDTEAFLSDCQHIHAERERMLFDLLRRIRRGMVACVFDAPDRIQHMFWRHIDPQHPMHDPNADALETEAIRSVYREMDALVGRVLAETSEDTAVLVMSDHGFKPFRREVDLNEWLRREGYLHLQGDRSASDESLQIDWTRTRAYAIGLAGIFLNISGRESQGIVSQAGEAQALATEIAAKLTGLTDPEDGNIAIREAKPSTELYRGPYVGQAPDIVVGYEPGYRVAWSTTSGKCGRTVFQDNRRRWSGDHCVHPEAVPGVLFTNRKDFVSKASIVDLAPTILSLLGAGAPAYMDGHSLLRDDQCAGDQPSDGQVSVTPRPELACS